MKLLGSVSGVLRVIVLLLGSGHLVSAAAYYTVTDLGTNSPLPSPFPRSFGLTSTIDTDNVPKLPGFIGAETHEPWMFPVEVVSANAQGNFIGAYPNGGSLALPYIDVDYYYFAKQPNGDYAPAVHIGPLFVFAGDFTPYLNAKDQVLTSSGLLNLDTNTWTALYQIVPPEFLAQFPLLNVVELSDNGSILAEDYDSGRSFLLTPPDQPVPTPEPSTFAMIAIGLGGLAIRRHWRRRLAD